MLLPGRITNPNGINGITKNKPITDALRLLLTRDPSEPLDDRPKTESQKIALALMKKAREGDINAIREITDRVEGKAAQSLEVKHVDPFDGLSTNDIIGLIETFTGIVESGVVSGEKGALSKKAGALQAVH